MLRVTLFDGHESWPTTQLTLEDRCDTVATASRTKFLRRLRRASEHSGKACPASTMSSTTGTPAAGSEKKTTMAAPPARPDSRVAFSIAPLSQPLSTTPTALLNKKAPDDKSDSNDDDSASVLDPNDEVEATSVVRDILRMFDDLKMQVDDANAPEEGEIAADLSDPIDVMSLDDMLLKIVAHIDDDIESVISAPEGGKEEGEVASDDGSLEDVSPDEGRKSAERQSAAIRSTSPMSVIEVKPRVEEIDSNYYSRSRTT